MHSDIASELDFPCVPPSLLVKLTSGIVHAYSHSEVFVAERASRREPPAPSLEGAALVCGLAETDHFELGKVLDELGIRLVIASNQGEALELVASRRFPLIFLNLDHDPEWPSTLRDFQALAPDSAVVACSLAADATLWIDVLDAGAFDLICKPFLRRELLWVVENAILKTRPPKSTG